MSDFETQARIVHKSNQIQNEIRSLHAWEQDMKHKEAQRSTSTAEETFDQSYPMRNQIQQTNTAVSATPTAPPQMAEILKRKTAAQNVEKANEFKTRGNDCVKNGQYQKAVHYYTEAIRLNKCEAIYYTNRALCYLKQNKFQECIDDCSAAIGLDANAVKAYYRRMQAREQLNDFEAALSDCRTVLRIEPKNGDAQRNLVKLEATTGSRVAEKSAPKQEPWSQFEDKDDYERIDFISKAPHLRSKQALNRITITDASNKKIPPTVPDTSDSNRVEEAECATTNGIDQTIKSNKPAAANTIKQNKVIPKNSAQFYKTWMSIKDDAQKFAILKGIYNDDVSKMLGAQFNLDILREIFTILKSHFIHQNMPIANILGGIVKNPQMVIVSAMMNTEDKLAFTKLIEYMRIRGEPNNKINAIHKIFDELISS